MGFFDRPDKAIDDLHKQAENLAARAKYETPEKAAKTRREATRLVRKAAFVRGTKEGE